MGYHGSYPARDLPPAALSELIDFAIAALAGRQQGLAARAQLLELGLDSHGITRRVKAGRLFRVFPGVYSVGRRPVTQLEWASATVLACGPGAALCDGSSLSLWGVWPKWRKPLHVAVATDRRPKGITVHRRILLPGDVRIQQGIRTTTLARALLDVAPNLEERQLWRAVDNGLLTPYLHRSQLAEQLVRHPHHPGAKRIAAYVVTSNGPTRSDWERTIPAWCEQHDLPQPTLSFRSSGHEVDAYFPGAELVVEFDSWEFHSSRRSFEDDRERDADNLDIGRPTLRITWRRLIYTAAREAERLHRILERRGWRAA